jgi:ABC-type phosphate transport system substrate-binding protein
MKKRIPSLSAVTVPIMVIVVLAAVTGYAKVPEILKFIGSKYVYYKVTDLATSYGVQEQPDTRITVSAANIDAALEQLADHLIDGVMIFGRLDEDRLLDAEENGLKLKAKVVGWGGVAIIVNRAVPVHALTVDQVRKILLGEYHNWSEVGGPDLPMVRMTRDGEVSGTENYIQDVLLQGLPVAQDTRRIFDYDIVRAVWKEKGAIADARYTEASRGQRRGKVRMIGLKKEPNGPAVIPTKQTIADGSYALSAPLMVYYDEGKHSPQAKAFLEFCEQKEPKNRYSNLGKRAQRHP